MSTSWTVVDFLRDYIEAIREGHLRPFTIAERLSRAATRNEPWGPTGSQLKELASMTQDTIQGQVIMVRLATTPHACYLSPQMISIYLTGSS
jgi:ENTH domain